MHFICTVLEVKFKPDFNLKYSSSSILEVKIDKNCKFFKWRFDEVMICMIGYLVVLNIIDLGNSEYPLLKDLKS